MLSKLPQVKLAVSALEYLCFDAVPTNPVGGAPAPFDPSIKRRLVQIDIHQ